MPDRSIHGVLGRSIAVALTSALRLQLLLVSGGAQRHGFGLRIAHVADSFNHPHRGVFDGAYMRALYELWRRVRKKRHRIRGRLDRAVSARLDHRAIGRVSGRFAP